MDSFELRYHRGNVYTYKHTIRLNRLYTVSNVNYCSFWNFILKVIQNLGRTKFGKDLIWEGNPKFGKDLIVTYGPHDAIGEKLTYVQKNLYLLLIRSIILRM